MRVSVLSPTSINLLKIIRLAYLSKKNHICNVVFLKSYLFILGLLLSTIFVVQSSYVSEFTASLDMSSCCSAKEDLKSCCGDCSENKEKCNSDCSSDCICTSQTTLALQENNKIYSEHLDFDSKTINSYAKKYEYLFEFDIDKPPNGSLIT